MSFRFTASVTQEGSYFVAQCLEVDVASQGESLEAALENLREALVLRFEGEAPPPTLSPAQVVPFDVELQTR